MKLDGQLERAQLENLANTSPTPTPLGRLYADITSTANAIPKFWNGTFWSFFRMTNSSGATDRVTRVLTAGSTDAMTAGDEVLVVKKTVGGATAVTLPASPATGRIVTIVDGKGDANTNNITVSPASGTINGAATKVINSSYGVLKFLYNGTEWNLL